MLQQATLRRSLSSDGRTLYHPELFSNGSMSLLAKYEADFSFLFESLGKILNSEATSLAIQHLYLNLCRRALAGLQLNSDAQWTQKHAVSFAQHRLLSRVLVQWNQNTKARRHSLIVVYLVAILGKTKQTDEVQTSSLRVCKFYFSKDIRHLESVC